MNVIKLEVDLPTKRKSNTAHKSVMDALNDLILIEHVSNHLQLDENIPYVVEVGKVKLSFIKLKDGYVGNVIEDNR